MELFKTKYFVLAILLSFSLVFMGCGSVAEKVSEEAIEKSIEKETGEKVEIDIDGDTTEITTKDGSLKVGSSYGWPADMPSDVPVFSYAKINGVIEATEEAGKSYTVTLSEMEKDAYEAYKSNLENNGWCIEFTQQSKEGWSMNAVKGVQGVQVLGYSDGNGMLVYMPDIGKY